MKVQKANTTAAEQIARNFVCAELETLVSKTLKGLKRLRSAAVTINREGMRSEAEDLLTCNEQQLRMIAHKSVEAELAEIRKGGNVPQI